jgi:hypothetical protein
VYLFKTTTMKSECTKELDLIQTINKFLTELTNPKTQKCALEKLHSIKLKQCST